MTLLRVAGIAALILPGVLAIGCGDGASGSAEKPKPICTESPSDTPVCYCDRSFKPDMPNRVEACVTNDCCGISEHEAGNLCFCWSTAFMESIGATCDEQIAGFDRRVSNCPG